MINLSTENWQIKNVDTILFDKDGTFIDLHYFWGKMTELRAQAVIARYNLDESLFARLCNILGYDVNLGKMRSDGITALYSRVIIIQKFVQTLIDMDIPATVDEITKLFDEVNIIFYKEMFNYTKPIQEAIDLIKKLKTSGVKIGVVTSDSKESTDLTIAHFHWENLFDVIIGRESTPETKESGVPVTMALEGLNADRNNTVMIGDAPMDYLAAKNAGVKNVVLVASGQITKESLLQTTNCVVESLSHVQVEIVEENFLC